ncbi:uncharacterized protein [Triticum aestivum]|uniref:uncharacterized protein n=1 Tax=Triticum aestivum TaxID=4565 RepID=UPI001D02350D|nr:uncharacterized protein LOC123162092 [Triticum aestivum]
MVGRSTRSGPSFSAAGPVPGNRTARLVGPVRSGPPAAGPNGSSVKDRTGPDRVHPDPHLTTLDLDGVIFSSKYSMDFSSCPNLETVKMHRCSFSIISCDGPIKISSQSVRYLSITDYNFRRYDKQEALISVPNLVYLELGSGRGKVPTFECTPLLLAASIKLDDKDGSFILERLSATINLELMIEPQASAAFRKELIRCTTFSKLKTLSLDDWCVEPDYSPLFYFLQRSPSLENLHLRLSKKYKHAEETDGSYAPIEPFLASKSPRAFNIQCLPKDERVHKIVKVLSSCGVTAELIIINKRIWSSNGSYSDSEHSNYSHPDSEQSNYSHSDSEQEQLD